MINIKPFIFAATAAIAFVGCQPAGTNTTPANSSAGANTAVNAAKPAAAAPTAESVMAIEKQSWEAWKARDAKAMATLMSDRYVGFSADGRVDKAGSLKGLERPCEVRSYSFSDEKLDMVGPDTAVLTYKAAQDYTCDGKKGPPNVWSAAVYVREGDVWKAAYYSETPVADPNAPAPATTATSAPAAKSEESQPDAATAAILAVEKRIWDAWKDKNASAIESVLGPNYFWVAGNGRTSRADIIKAWSADNKCDVKSASLTDAKAVSLTADVSLLTYKGSADGTCEGKPIPTEWYAAVYTRKGDTWQPAVGTSAP